MHTVRIRRKTKSNTVMALNWFKLVLDHILRPMAQPYIDQERAVMQDARLEKVRKDTELAEVRKQVQMDELVIRDLKIDKEKIQLELLEYKARMLGLRSGGNDWTCSRCGGQNTPMVTACSFCNAPK